LPRPAPVLRQVSRGRGPAALILGLFLVAQLAGSGFFERPRLDLFDLYQRWQPRQRQGAPVTIVAIDDASLAALGQWPWPRQRLALLIDRILAGGPAALGIDLIMPEPDRLSPEQWRQDEALPPALAEALGDRPAHDALLAAAIGRGPVVLAVAGLRDGSTAPPGPWSPVRRSGSDPAFDLHRILPRYQSELRSLKPLDAAAAGHGLISVDPDRDGLVRRLPLVSLVGDTIAPSLVLDVLRLAAGARHIDLVLDGDGIEGIQLDELAIPTQADGSLWVRLSPHDEARFVSAADVLAGRVSADVFDHRLVLLGVSGLGLVDRPMTALGRMPGVEIDAQLLETIVDGRLAARPSWAGLAEAGLTLFFGGALILMLPGLRLRLYPVAALLPLFGLAALGAAAWRFGPWLIDAATPLIGNAAVFVALLATGLADADRQRRELRRDLEVQRLSAAKLAGELEAASRIQTSILPRPSSLPADRRFDLDAVMVPARVVGGDLYDFFMLDEDHLFFAIGDVSGKGVEASLFMALGKALYRSCALREHGIGAIMAAANAEIARENAQMMFITLFAGILDLATGTLAFCNAGHDPPFLVQPGTVPRSVDGPGGLALGVFEEFDYQADTVVLQPGEILCLTTDGVSEAANAAEELMGRARAAAALAGLQPGVGATAALAALRVAVDSFVAGAEPSDDITMLALRWTGG
jgi:serine phosphatase RsbU (regulator of sigma subunit)/CHASE2 domain-containing sensor protein